MLKHEEKEEEKVAEYPDQSHMISNLKQINNKLNEYLTNGIKENGHLDVDINREQYNTLQENDDVNHNSAQNTDLEHGEIINSGDKVTLQPVDINKKDGVKAVLETKKHTIVKFEKPDKENIERDKKLENQSLIDNKETLIDIKENENHSMKNERELKQNGKGDLTDDKGPNKQTATGNLDSENIEMMTLTSDNMIYKAQNHLHGQAIYSNPNLPTFLQNSLEEALSKIVIGEKSQEKTIEFIDYKDERHLPDLTSLITKDLSEPYSVYTYRYFLHNWPNLSFLAYCGETCVGAIVCKLDQHHKDVWRGYIAMLVVHKDYRRFKIGSKLVQKAIRRMIENGCDEVVLETEVTNRAALNLYENLGFVRDKRLLRYYLNGVDAWRLKLWLQ